MLREKQCEVNMGHRFESRLHIYCYHNNHFLSFAQQVILIVASWLFSHGENNLDTELWENCGVTRMSEHRVTRKDKLRTARTPKVLKSHWGRRLESYPDPKNVDNPMIAHQDYDVRESGRVLELQNRDLWIRPTDLSWHFPILVTILEMPFKNYRGRSSEKLEAREDKIEEAKKQNTLKNRDEDWNSARWKQPSWTWTTSSSSSAWREWRSDETHERPYWQSADWDLSDQVRKATAWQSNFSWQ